MGVFYEMSGSVEVKECPEVDSIIERFNEEGGPDLYIEKLEGIPEGQSTIQFVGGVYCSCLTIETLDDIVRELGEFVVKPGFINYEFDGERGKLYIGKEGDEEELVSADARDEIQNLIESLTTKDREIVRGWLS